MNVTDKKVLIYTEPDSIPKDSLSEVKDIEIFETLEALTNRLFTLLADEEQPVVINSISQFDLKTTVSKRILESARAASDDLTYLASIQEDIERVDFQNIPISTIDEFKKRILEILGIPPQEIFKPVKREMEEEKIETPNRLVNIVIIDDEDDEIEEMRQLLSSCPNINLKVILVQEKTTVEEIIKEIGDSDILLLDTSMGRISGGEVFQDLKRSGKKMPALLSTSTLSEPQWAQQFFHSKTAMKEYPEAKTEFIHYMNNLLRQIGVVKSSV